MSARRRLFILVVAVLIVLAGSIVPAQDVTYRDATLGALGIDKDEYVALVELSLKNPNTGAPAVYFVKCHNCPLESGRTYRGRMQGHKVAWIEINGSQIMIGNSFLSDNFFNLQAWDCAKRPAPEGGHWEWDSSDKLPKCEPGTKDPIKWKAAKSSNQQTTRSKQSSKILPCDLLQQPFHDTVLTVVITVKPVSGLEWTFPEAASHVARRILDDLNANRRNITFKEASGVVPNLYINVTVSETREGTKQDTANAEVTGLGKAGTLFSATSGQAPFTALSEAIDHLSTNMLTWFEGGWHRPGPCVAPNGEVLP